jgi:two-component system chemotaxis sensor kinase CheA
VPDDLDMSRYLGLFVAEATEHLEALSQDLVALERTRTPESVDSLFRHAHSVKGMAASMGLEAIATLAHRVEDLVEAFRSGEGALEQGLGDLMLEATDTMRAQVRAAGTADSAAPPTALLARLAEAVLQRTGHPPAPTRIARSVRLDAGPALAAVPESTVLEVSVRVPPTSASPGARAFLVYRALAALGTVLSVRPTLDELRAGALPDGRLVLCVDAPGGASAIQHALTDLPEVQLLSLPSPSRRAACGSVPSSWMTFWNSPASCCWPLLVCGKWGDDFPTRTARCWRRASTDCTA